jgi:hypothetical protein
VIAAVTAGNIAVRIRNAGKALFPATNSGRPMAHPRITGTIYGEDPG